MRWVLERVAGGARAPPGDAAEEWSADGAAPPRPPYKWFVFADDDVFFRAPALVAMRALRNFDLSLNGVPLLGARDNGELCELSSLLSEMLPACPRVRVGNIIGSCEGGCAPIDRSRPT